MGFRILFCNARRWTACVQQKFESVYLHVIKKHRNNLLFSYYELGFRCFELNLFSHCFDSVRFEKFKPEQALRTLDWKDSLFTRNSLDLTKCLKFMLFMLPDQTAASKAIHSKPNENCRKHGIKFTINCSE